ncbi:Os08g0500200, partial [Oryza sativa Japonica Group]
MGMKFLNKKGWHTGSLRNIERVWVAEEKEKEEQRKIQELKKQQDEEREKAAFRKLQEDAGLKPRQERLDFLYESGLAVGKGSSEGFQALQPSAPAAAAAASSSAQASAGSSKAAAPGALFEDKPQSANDAWRKLHTDPLLLIRQREQDAIARIKNNPIKMAEIKKSV